MCSHAQLGYTYQRAGIPGAVDGVHITRAYTTLRTGTQEGTISHVRISRRGITEERGEASVFAGAMPNSISSLPT